MQRISAAVVGAVLLLSACGPSGSPVDVSDVEVLAQAPSAPEKAAASPAAPEANEIETAPAPAPPDTTTTAPTAPAPSEGQQTETSGSSSSASSAPQQCGPAEGGGDHIAQLVDVRVGTHQGFDRVVLELAPPSQGAEHFGLPWYEVRSITPPITEDGSGHVVGVEGAHFAGIVLHGASGVEFTDQEPGYVLTYQGPRELRPRFEVLREAQLTGDFERTLSWAFGLAKASCWKVRVLDDPLRLVIDFPH